MDCSPNVDLVKKSLCDLEAKLKSEGEPLSLQERWGVIGQAIMNFIQINTDKVLKFLLPDVINFIYHINIKNLIFPYVYKLLDFEIWMNHNIAISKKQNAIIRQNIVGMKLSKLEESMLIPGINRSFALHDLPIVISGHPYPDADASVVAFLTWCLFFYEGQHTCTMLACPEDIPNYSTIQLFESKLGYDKKILPLIMSNNSKPFIPAMSLNWQYIDEGMERMIKEDNVVSMDTDWLTLKAKFDDVPDNILFIGIPRVDGSIAPMGVLSKDNVNQTTACNIFLCDYSSPADFCADRSYIKLVGVIDHHKAQLSSNIPIYINVEPVQACSTLIGIKFLEVLPTHINDLMWNIIRDLLLYAILDDTDNFSRYTLKDLYVSYALLQTNTSYGVQKRSSRIKEYSCQDYLNWISKSKAYQHFIEWSTSIKSLANTKMMLDFVKSPSAHPQYISDIKITNKKKAVVTQIKLLPSNVDTFLIHKDHIITGWLDTSRKYASINNSEGHIMMITNLLPIIPNQIQSCGSTSVRDFFFIWQPENAEEVFTLSFIENFVNHEQYNKYISRVVINSDYPLNNIMARNKLQQLLNNNFSNVVEATLGSDNVSLVLEIEPGFLLSRKTNVMPFISSHL